MTMVVYFVFVSSLSLLHNPNPNPNRNSSPNGKLFAPHKSASLTNNEAGLGGANSLELGLRFRLG